MTNKAIIIKGPSADCKSYFTGLPDTLEELIQKASQLFPVPPNHTAHLMLDGDDAILMPDVLHYLKDREVLTFHWTTNTPRSSMRQPSRKSEEMSRMLNSSGGSSSGSNESGSRTSRGVRWDQSVLAKTDVSMARSNSEGNGSTPQYAPAKSYRYSSAARAEHSRRVLSEQQEQKDRTSKNDDRDPFLPSNKASDGNDSQSQSDPPNTSPQTAQHDIAATQSSLVEVSRVADIAALSPSQFNVKEISSRSQSDEEQQNSSPLASPTRNIRGAQKSNSEWGTPLGSDKGQKVAMGHDENTKASIDIEASSLMVKPNAVEKEAQATVAASTVKSPTSPSEEVRDKQTAVAYKRMASVVDTLRHHPSNVFFTEDSGENALSFANFLKGCGRPVTSLAIISDRIHKRSYRKSAPFQDFAADLSQLWSNARAFYGAGSPQALCGDLLERFSRIIMNEWRKDGADNRSKQDPTQSAAESKSQAMARAAKLMQEMSHSKTSVTPPNRLPNGPKSTHAKSQQPSRPMSVQRSSSTDSKDQLQQPTQSKQATNFASAPGTQAFLASLFTKGNMVAHPTSASIGMMSKLQQQFGPAPLMTTMKNVAPMRMSLSPRSQHNVLPKGDSVVEKKVHGVKRPLEDPTAAESVKRAHLAEGDGKPADVVMTEAGAAVAIPTLVVEEKSSNSPKTKASAKTAKQSPVRQSKTAKAPARSSPRSSGSVAEQRTVDAQEAAQEDIDSAASPRRSPRSVQPTAKVREAGRLQMRARKAPSPAATTAADANSSPRPVERTTTTNKVPQRMMTRGVAASITGTPRGRRTTTV